MVNGYYVYRVTVLSKSPTQQETHLLASTEGR